MFHSLPNRLCSQYVFEDLLTHVEKREKKETKFVTTGAGDTTARRQVVCLTLFLGVTDVGFLLATHKQLKT